MKGSILHPRSPQFGDSEGLVEWNTHPIFPPFLFPSPFPPLLAPGSQVSNQPWSRALLPLDPRIGVWKANPRINSNLSTTIANYPTSNKLILWFLPFLICKMQTTSNKKEDIALALKGDVSVKIG